MPKSNVKLMLSLFLSTFNNAYTVIFIRLPGLCLLLLTTYRYFKIHMLVRFSVYNKGLKLALKL